MRWLKALLFIFLGSFSVMASEKFHLKQSEHLQWTNQDLLSLILPLKPNRHTYYELKRKLPTPDVETQVSKKVVLGWRLDAPPGSATYDVLLTFEDGMLIQIERPVIEDKFDRFTMENRYGLPKKIEVRPPAEDLPSRTLYFYPTHGLTFIQNQKTKKMTGIISYAKKGPQP